jgi:hydrogenase-4 component B
MSMDLLIHFGFPAALALYALGAALSLALSSRATEGTASALAHVCAALGALAGLCFALAVIFSGTVLELHAGTLGLAGGILNFRIDGLAAFFIATISTVALAASVYGIGYQKQFLGRYRLGLFGFCYNIFLACMLAVVAADNGILFLFAWEAMAISSYFLVVFERREARNIAAGRLYILISQTGAAFLFAAFILLYGATGSWDFDVLRAHAGDIPALLTNIILACALIGFASKAGVIPLHIWLPEAHPAAPSHVSALMSGVMIKTAIFMLIRFFVEFFPGHASWGLIILALGAISSLLGVLYALSEHDIKRLLAFHSVENIGIILLGVGASITFFAYGIPVAGYIALAAALYHTVNHALFKSLLFLSAGSVVHAMHTRNMEKYGGLIKLMPWTSFLFLIGAVAISGLPPFNGFVSEWLTFQSLFAGILSLPLAAKVVFILGAGSLAFTGGLAAACFVKVFGTTFLARPRSEAAARAHECGWLMKIPMVFLAVLTLLFGIGASSITPVIAGIATGLRGSGGSIPPVNPLSAIGIGSFASLSMFSVGLALLAGVVLVYLFVSVVSRNMKTSVSRTWDCGSPLSPRMEITATGFSRSLITIFRGLLRPGIERSTEYHDAAMPYFAKSRTVRLSMPDLYRTYLYDPAASIIEKSALKARRIQGGNLNVYLLYILLTVAALLLWTLK